MKFAVSTNKTHTHKDNAGKQMHRDKKHFFQGQCMNPKSPDEDPASHQKKKNQKTHNKHIQQTHSE